MSKKNETPAPAREGKLNLNDASTTKVVGKPAAPAKTGGDQ